MEINLAKSAGFCFGVKRAIDIAFGTAKANKNVYMLGDIVHNEDVIRQIQQAGIKKIKRLTSGQNKTLLIRAHGSGINIIKKAQGLGYNLVDATCPMVKEIHKIAKTFQEKGYKIIIIGDKKHDEVHGISGQLKSKALVIEGLADIPLKAIRQMKKATVVVQSTQDMEKVSRIARVLKKYIRDLKFFNTICRPTRMKQEEIRNLPLNNDLMIIIGSKNSANTKRLYQISKSINKQSHWINSAKEIEPEWFKDAKSVGITAGASTPESTIQGVIEHISFLF